MKNFDLDKIWIGLIIGLIVPFLVLFGYYFINYRHMTVQYFINYLVMGDIHIKVISLCVLGNLAAFYPFIWKEKWQGARGVIGATIVWAFSVLILKFFY